MLKRIRVRENRGNSKATMFQFTNALGRRQPEAGLNRVEAAKRQLPQDNGLPLSLSWGRARTWERFMGSVSRKADLRSFCGLSCGRGRGVPCKA